jgi:hypothetical protein
METNKYKNQQDAKVGDTIIITRHGSVTVTKDKEYEVTDTANGWAGQGVSIIDDFGNSTTLNSFWWDFPSV